MKKFLKFLPIALGVISLASCADDLFTSNAASDDSNALYFAADNGESTRAGFSGDATDSYGNLKFRWTKGDQIRVYDQNLALYDIYQYNGPSFSETDNKDANKFNNTIDKMLDSYEIGIFPADQVEAVYLDKSDRDIKHIEMTLPVEYAYEEATGDKEGYRADIPMYGNIDNVANAIDNQMNMLTAWTNIFLRDVPADVKYIAVVSKTTNLTGIYEAQVSRVAAKNAEPWLVEKTSADPSAFGKMVWSKVNLTDPAVLKEKAGISFPIPVGTYDEIAIYGLKTGAGKTPTQVGDAIDDWKALVTAGNAIEIAKRENLTFKKRRQCWQVKYTFTYYLDTDAVDPFRPGEISKVLEAEQNNVVGNFKIVPYSAADGLTPVDPTKAKTLNPGAGDNYTHCIEIPNIKKNQNAHIIIDLSGAGIQYDEALQIVDKNPESNQFEGKLTIIPGEIKGGTAKIEVKLPKAEVYIVGDGSHPLGNVDVQNAKTVHIGDGLATTTQDAAQNTKFQAGTLVIEKNATVQNVFAERYPGVNPTTPKEIVINGGEVANLTVNEITDKFNITMHGGKISSMIDFKEATKTSNQKVYIYSDGDAHIQDIGGGKYSNVTITSKWTVDETTGKGCVSATDLYEQSLDESTIALATDFHFSGDTEHKFGHIYTAAQLAKLQTAIASGYKNFVILADTIDMADLEWTGAAHTGSVNIISWNGCARYLNPYYAAASQPGWGQFFNGSTADNLKKSVIKNLNIKAADTQGFVGKANGLMIRGIDFKDVKLQATADKSSAVNLKDIGALVGLVDVDKTLTITDVTVEGAVLKNGGGTASTYIGGLVGRVAKNGQATLEDVTVKDAAIAGHYFVGGILGSAGISSKVTMTNVKTDNLTLALFNTSLYKLDSNKAGTFGTFIGGGYNGATIKLYDCDHGTVPYSAAAVKINSLCFQDNVKDDLPFFGGNPWIGHVVTNDAKQDGTLNSLISFKKNGATTTYTSYNYGKSSMTKSSLVDKDNVAQSGNVTTIYDGTTGTGHSAPQYGYNIWKNYTIETTFDETFNVD